MTHSFTKTKYTGVYKRESSTGRVTYYIRPTIRGQQTWRKAGDTLTEARNLYAQYKELKRLEGFGIKLPERRRFHDVCDEYERDYIRRKQDEDKKRTRQKGITNLPRFQSVIRGLKHRFGDPWMHELDTRTIEEQHVPHPDIGYLSAILHLAKRRGYITEIPEFYKPPRNDGRKTILHLDELKEILDQCSPLHRDAILVCVYLGGCRVGELAMMDTQTVDFQHHTIEMPDGRKADVPKTFIMIPQAETILRRRILENGGRAFPFNPKDLSYKFHKEREKIRTRKHWVFHTLRHSCPTLMYEMGIEIETISAVLGHKSVEMTRRYIHSTMKRERAALEALGLTIDGALSNTQ